MMLHIQVGSLFSNHFYPCNAMSVWVLAVVMCLCVSVCLSVCVCVCLSHAGIVSKWLHRSS